MKKKKSSILLPLSKCCLKKFYDLDLVSKYGSIIAISILALYQMYNILTYTNIEMSIFSLLVDFIFLLVVLTKLEMIKIELFKKHLTLLLKIIITVFILNFFGYLLSNDPIHGYVLAPISFLCAYFVFLLNLK